MSIEAMQQALGALEKCAVMIDGEWGICRSLAEMDETDCLPQGVRGPIIALRIAIEAAEKQEQEPVAYLCENAVGHKYFRWKKPSSTYKPIALYTTPPAAITDVEARGQS